MPFLLEVEPLDLGADVKAVGLELVQDDENREPARGSEAAAIWARVLPSAAAAEPWALDFFSHIERVRDYCDRHGIPFRAPTNHSVVIAAPDPEKLPGALSALFERFEAETFGARAGGPLLAGDAPLETELAHRGVDAYHSAFPNYFFCAVCDFEEGSLVLLSDHLWASEIIRRIRPSLSGLDVHVRLPA